MLYVFHVNGGRMLTFDMSSALDTVLMLKDTIEKNCGIPTGNQVLLIGGGEILVSDAKVFSYSAGTDSNPIFMFSTNNLQDPVPVPVFRDDHYFNEIIETALSLPATYETVVKRAKIATQLFDVADDETRRCERMVHEQHLQQQGWLAVVANMEDLTKEFTQRFNNFYATLDEHLGRRAEYHECLAHFEEDLRTLDRIPISPSLVAAATGHQSFQGFGSNVLHELADNSSTRNDSLASSSSIHDVFAAPTVGAPSAAAPSTTTTDASVHGSDVASTAGATTDIPLDKPADSDADDASENSNSTLTLLQWLTARDAQSSLQNVAMNCGRIIAMFDAPMIQQLKQTVDIVLGQAQQESMREIRGVAPRFMGLDKLMVNATKLVKEQSKINTAFQNNQNRASVLGDASILPDLCESHASQLTVMLTNHTHLSDIHRRIYMSKEELSNNLTLRIRFMVQLENRMSELDAKMLFFNRCLRRVQRHLIVIEQIHSAPTMYVHAIGEVLRRRTFATLFVQWSKELVQNWSGIYNEEVSRRLEFSSRFEGHFLSGLFTGLEDVPPAYAIEEPIVFDANLPNVTMNDMTYLAKLMPELAAQVALPDLRTVVQFFMTNNQRFAEGIAAPTSAVDSTQQPPFAPKPIDMLSHLKDGCDSETDTEDFEKLATPATITTSTITATRSTSTENIQMHSAETLTDECASSSANAATDVDRMRSILQRMQSACQHSFGSLRIQLADLKDCSQSDRQQLEQQFKGLCSAWQQINDSTRTACHSQLEQLTGEHQRQLAAVQRSANAAQSECARLHSENVDLAMMQTNAHTEAAELREQLQQIVADMNARTVELEQRLANADADRQRAVRETHDQLQRNHKTEVESLRSRFKLMAHMERSPSDTSLEKIERSEFAEATAAVAIPPSNQASMDFTSSMLSESMQVVQQQPRAASATSALQSPGKSSIDVFRHILFTKEQELEQIRGGLQSLQTENRSLREAIQALTLSATQQQTDDELIELRRQLHAEQTKRAELEQALIKSQNVASLSNEEKTIAVATATTTPSTATTSTTAALTTTTTVTTTTVSSLTKSKSSCSRRSVSIDGCTKGDNVLVMWNPQHNQYTILQDNSIIYFLHADSYAALHLEPPPPALPVLQQSAFSSSSCIVTSTLMATSTTSPMSSLTPPATSNSCSPSSTCSPSNSSNAPVVTTAGQPQLPPPPPMPSPLEASAAAAAMHRQWMLHDTHTQRQTPAVIGKLIDKEFCYARKDMNRYKVQRGAKFYRVKVAPTSPIRCLDPTGKCCAKRSRHEAASSVVVAVDPTAAAAPANTLTAPSSAPSTTVARSLISSFAQTDNATLPTAPLQTQSQQKLPIIQVADESTAITTSPASDVAMTETIPCSVPEVVVLDQAIGTVVASVTDIIDGSTQSCDETVSEDTTPYHSLDAKTSADSSNLPRSISNASSETASVPDEN